MDTIEGDLPGTLEPLPYYPEQFSAFMSLDEVGAATEKALAGISIAPIKTIEGLELYSIFSHSFGKPAKASQ
jgi:hypothetical protein